MVDRLLAGDERALAQAISAVENESPAFEALLEAIHGLLGRARRIGITGPPGAGKSTLVAGLVEEYVRQGHRVGVIAVDPTSPFTGGALLGDRIRMTELATVPGVFIRSMASRGSVGGLATSALEAADLMDAFGIDRILLETMGVGQSELDIAGSADTTAVVLVPESGDGIQAMKAGLMEVADLFVVNKADRPGAERLETEIRVMMAIRRGIAWRGIPSHVAHDRHHAARVDVSGQKEGEPEGRTDSPSMDPSEWRRPVLRTVASTGEGLGALVEELDRHFEFLEQAGELERRRGQVRVERARNALLRRLRRAGLQAWEDRREQWEARLSSGEASPYQVAHELWTQLAGESFGK